LLARVKRHAREAMQRQQTIGLRTAALPIGNDHRGFVAKYEFTDAQIAHQSPLRGPVARHSAHSRLSSCGHQFQRATGLLPTTVEDHEGGRSGVWHEPDDSPPGSLRQPHQKSACVWRHRKPRRRRFRLSFDTPREFAASVVQGVIECREKVLSQHSLNSGAETHERC
jgi:hypothetical protein